MKCFKCGFELDYKKENWQFKDYEDPTYEVTSQIFDKKLLEQIIDHASNISYKPDTITIDTCIPDINNCQGCSEITEMLGSGVSAGLSGNYNLTIQFCF
jgi:hypothetical protein